MAWVTPPVFTVGQLLTSVAMNEISGDLSFLHDPLWDSTDAGVVFPTASITTSTLAQTFKHLLIEVSLRDDSAVGENWFYLRFNGDTGGNYGAQYLTAAAASVAAANATGQTRMRAGLVAGGSLGTTGAGGGFIEIPDYIGARKKFAVSQSHVTNSGADLGVVGGRWDGVAAISTITFLPESGNFAAGRITVYGK